MKNDFFGGREPGMRSTWNANRMLVRRRLTDRQIEKYRKAGWYSAEFREARRQAWERKQAKSKAKRDGNFVLKDGRMIYNPL